MPEVFASAGLAMKMVRCSCGAGVITGCPHAAVQAGWRVYIALAVAVRGSAFMRMASGAWCFGRVNCIVPAVLTPDWPGPF